jgi:pentose-5-phosphate-3-epimerase
MKISASIFSDSEKNILTTIDNLNNYHVDLIHVDCNDRLSIFDDIKIIRENSTLPIDLHIITDTPEVYYIGIIEYNIEYVTFQYETLKEKKLSIPAEYKGKLGVGITTITNISIFEEYKDHCDFILMMATIPGKSGGQFDKSNFTKIRKFSKQYPDKKIHVDGGVNAEVSFILRNMGVYLSVSGSYLFNSVSIGSALLNLKLNEIESHFLVKDFMQKLESSPVINLSDLTLENLLLTFKKGALGFAIVNNENDKFAGIIGNADLRNGLLKHVADLNNINMSELINPNPLVINENATVHEMLKFIKKQTKPVIYLPVLNNDNKTVGIVSFLNLIKGEL